jgi:hypothetical protein
VPAVVQYSKGSEIADLSGGSVGSASTIPHSNSLKLNKTASFAQRLPQNVLHGGRWSRIALLGKRLLTPAQNILIPLLTMCGSLLFMGFANLI